MDIVLLYVKDVIASAKFYEQVVHRGPVELSPGFAMFILPDGQKLGLWKRDAVIPSPSGTPGAGELAWVEADTEAVSTRCQEWRTRGWPIAQEPEQLDFGYTFVALDPDGHRLRVFSRANQDTPAA